jgi:hypothetical protein
MNRLSKILLLWLLIAMLPLHAVGASMPMSCDPVHHQAMQKAAHDAAHQAHDGMHHQHDTSMAMHDHHHDVGQNHYAAPDDGVADASTSGLHPHAGCSACSAGCLGAAAPPLAWHATPAIVGSEAVLIAPSPLIAGYTPDRLDRPPRVILA